MLVRGDRKLLALLVVCNILFNVTHSHPLDIVAGKTGEEQVRDALDRAEKESAQAAKEHSDKSTTAKLKQETEEFLSDSTNKLTRSSTDLKATLDKKVEELAKFHEKHNDHNNNNNNDHNSDHKILSFSENLVQPSISSLIQNKLKTTVSLAEIAKGDHDISDELNTAETKEKENAVLEDESDKKMVEMAKKLNNLVLKFQKKMGRLQHRPKNIADLLPQKDQTDESTVKSIRGKPATHAPIDLTALKNALGLLHTGKTTASATGAGGLANALGGAIGGGLSGAIGGGVSTGGPPKPGAHEQKLSYKEDTKLEDRLAMEAEEEKKFSNGDTYDDGEGGEEKSSSSSSKEKENAVSSLSPKEQASQEMQSYNALISSESNRELSQIQDEITKATQSSMGQVSVVGQKENVNTEPPTLPSLGNLGGSENGGSNGGIDNGLAAALSEAGGLNGGGGMGGGMGGAMGKSAEGGGGGGGASSFTDQFQGLQGASSQGGGSENMGEQSTSVGGTEGAATQQSNPVTDPMQGAMQGAMQEQNPMQNGGMPGQEGGGATGDNQSPIEIGGSQDPVEMGTLNGNNNLFAGAAGGGGQGGGPGGGGQFDQQMQQSMQSITSSFNGGGASQTFDVGGGGGGGGQGSQPSMSFKKSKITGKALKKHNHRRFWKKSKLPSRQRSFVYDIKRKNRHYKS